MYLFFWLGRVFAVAHGHLSSQQAGATLRGGVWHSHCGGVSGCGPQALGHLGFCSCGSVVRELTRVSCSSG